MKLHIGSGERYLPGYTHIDIVKHPHIDYVADAKQLSFLESESVSEIYACHVLEHIKRFEVVDVLREWHRVLMPGGIIRLAVPDFSSMVNEYMETHTLEPLLGLLYGGQNHEYNFHYQVFDYNRIFVLLTLVGFRNIQRYEWESFLPNGFDDFSRAYLPHLDFDNGRLMSLNVFATKR